MLGNQPKILGQTSLGDIGMQMSVNGVVASIGTGAACLGHPLRAAYWLAKKMAELGTPLRAGEVILSGALGPMIPLKAGDVVTATIGELGNIGCRIV